MKLYHYTNLKTLALILKHRTLRFNRLDKVDDLEENVKSNGLNLGQYIFVSCWTEDAEESIPLWRMYAGIENGVRICLDEDMFQTYDICNFTFRDRVPIRGSSHSLIPQKDIENPDYFIMPLGANNRTSFLKEVEYVPDIHKYTDNVAQIQLKETSGVLKEEMLGNTPFAIYCGKWDIRKMSEEWRSAAKAAGNNKYMTGINVVRMRYPQVLLMYAEVMNELAGPDGGYTGSAGITARKALETVHARAYDEANKSIAENYISAIPANKEDFFNAIVNENAWELAGEGFRKFDLIRWNLLSKKIEEFKANYISQLNEYPDKIYFNYEDAAKTIIDMSSVTWFEKPADPAKYADSKAYYGAELTATTKTQLLTNLPSISSGLNSTVKNRYLMPIASTTISASNGKMQNSYSYSN